MAVIKVETTVIGALNTAQVFMEGQEIALNHNSAEVWHSIKNVNVKDGVLNVICNVRGIANTKWALVINQLDPPPSHELFNEDDFKVPATGLGTVPIAINI